MSAQPTIIGVGMTRFGKHGQDLREMTQEAVAEALQDAGVGAGEIEAAYFANGAAGLVTGQEMIRGQVALRHTGVLGAPIYNVENACASGTTAFGLACTAVESGQVDLALVVGAEKLTHHDKQVTFGAIGSATDQLEPPPFMLAREDGESRSSFMDLYSRKAMDYMRDSGATVADFATVCVKNRAFGADNPRAQFRSPVTAAEVTSSRTVVDPLTLLMCAPIGDGAAALVIASPRFGSRIPDRTPITVRASVLVSGRDRSEEEPTATQRAADRAYERAGLGPEDLSLAEVHDAAAPAELIAYEALRLCEPGGGPDLLRGGATSLGGRVPVNVSGGLLARGHPLGATGCAQLVELVDQLWGRAGVRQVQGARVGLSHNGGGNLGTDSAAMAVTILSR